MSTQPHIQFSHGKPGQGHYGNCMGEQNQSELEFAKDRILKAVDSIPVNDENDHSLFTIGDYGAADGYTTFPLIRQIIEMIRKKHGDIPVQVVYEDQPANDFNSLMKRVHGLIPDSHSYLKDFKQVYVMASSTSFFEQVIPDNTAHLIISFNAVQYLSKAVTKFQNSFHRFPNANEEERQLVTVQAAKDWEKFLLQRAKELKSGGVLVVSTSADDPTMTYPGVRHDSQAFEEGILRMWCRMRNESKITQEEFVNTNMHRCTRHLKELTAPFQDTKTAVYRAGLRLMNAETILSPCLAQKRWIKKMDQEGTDDRETWATAVLNVHRVWTSYAFIRGLASTRSESEKEAVVAEMYDRLEKEILAQDPREFPNDTLLNYVFIRKI